VETVARGAGCAAQRVGEAQARYGDNGLADPDANAVWARHRVPLPDGRGKTPGCERVFSLSFFFFLPLLIVGVFIAAFE